MLLNVKLAAYSLRVEAVLLACMTISRVWRSVVVISLSSKPEHVTLPRSTEQVDELQRYTVLFGTGDMTTENR
jgi:hypothetical protein